MILTHCIKALADKISLKDNAQKVQLFHNVNTASEMTTYSVDVLWRGCVGSVGPVALEGEVVFGSKVHQQTHSHHLCPQAFNRQSNVFIK